MKLPQISLGFRLHFSFCVIFLLKIAKPLNHLLQLEEFPGTTGKDAVHLLSQVSSLSEYGLQFPEFPQRGLKSTHFPRWRRHVQGMLRSLHRAKLQDLFQSASEFYFHRLSQETHDLHILMFLAIKASKLLSIFSKAPMATL